MNLETIVNISLALNLVSSVINVIAYGLGYYRIWKSNVDGQLKLTKNTILFEFVTVIVTTVLFAFVYKTALFDKGHLNEALYVLNFTLLFFNIAFNINAVLLALITEKGTKK